MASTDPYTHVRVFAHTPFTGKGAGHETVEKNIDAFKKAVSLALSEVNKLKDGDDVLPIFVAPEWTWKQKTGFYGPDDLAMIYTFLTVTSKSNTDVLFFPGTVLWGLPGDATPEVLKKSYPLGDLKVIAQNLASKKGVSTLYNSVPVFLEGKLIHNLNQQFEDTEKTGADRFDFEAGPDKGKDFWRNFKGNGSDVDWNGGARQGSQVFVDGRLVQGSAKKSVTIQFGVETGLDTTYTVLQKTGKKVDIQVLLSGGTALDVAAVSTRPYGLAIQCDGNNQDYRKFGLKVFTVDEPVMVPPSTAGLAFFGDEKSAVVVLKRALPLMRLLMKPDYKTRPAKLRAQDYLDFRRKCAMAKPDELKEVFQENLSQRAAWAKVARTQTAISVIDELLDSFTWDGDQWRKARKAIDEDMSGEPCLGFTGSVLGLSLGFLLGVNQHLDAMFKTLGALDDELFLLGNYLTDEVDSPGLCWIQGPLKKFGDAFEKTVYRDYKGNAADNKDLVRGTIVTNTTDPKRNQEMLGTVVARIEKVAVPDFGMNILTPKEKREAKPKVSSGATDKNFLMDCGYSGWNFKILFNGHPKVPEPTTHRALGDVGKGWAEGTSVPQDADTAPIPAEIQVNTREMMFGKHSQLLLKKMKVFKDDADYANHEKAVGFQGGLGHVFYEINRVAKDSKDGLAAAALARDYHEMCRKVPYGSDKAKLSELAKNLDEFLGKLEGGKAQEIWKDHYDDKWKASQALSSGADSRKETW